MGEEAGRREEGIQRAPTIRLTDRRIDRRTEGISLEGVERKAKEAGSRILINGIDPYSFAYVNRGAGV